MQISTNTGKLNQRITIQHKPLSVTDEIGYQPDGWTDFHTCWAAVNTASGSESWQSGERVQESTVNFKIRACKLLKEINTTEYRIVYGGRYYDIVAIDDMLFAGSLLNIRTVEKKPLFFGDGIAFLYDLRKAADSGSKPELELICETQFNYVKIANHENYTEAQKNIEHELEIVIPMNRSLSVLNVVEIDGKCYEIVSVEHDKETLMPSTRIRLTRLEAELRKVILISEDTSTDEIGQIIESDAAQAEVFCLAKSVTRTEWSTAYQYGFQAEWMLEVLHADYQGQRIADFDGQRYTIYRSFCAGERTELYLGLRVGDLNAVT